MILEAFGQALSALGSSQMWIYILIGTVAGLIIGIIPGLSALVAIPILMPFMFHMPLEPALALMVSLEAVGFTGGSITAILINVPGTEPNAATLMDGFPMSQKGQGGRALGAALASSSTGGVIVVFLALLMISLVLPMVLAITSADMVFLIFMGITFIAVLGKGSMTKGLISGGLGLLISFIGFEGITAESRFSFGSLYLYDGITLVPLALGLFAIPEVIRLVVSGGTIAKKGTLAPSWSSVVEGMKDVFRHWGLTLRSAIIGYIVGVIPGIGGTTAAFLAYGQAKATSRHPERFGTGIVEGVIAPESAMNASSSGALLTTMVLGIPGSAASAIMLGAFLLVGLIPGPDMITKHLDMTINLQLVIIISNLLGLAICLPILTKIVKVAFVPSRILAPLLAIIILVAAYVTREEFLDVLTLLIFGLVGVVITVFKYNKATLFLGFIMGRLLEKYFYIAYNSGGSLFFLRPISLTLIAITIFMLFWSTIRGAFERRKGGHAA